MFRIYLILTILSLLCTLCGHAQEAGRQSFWRASKPAKSCDQFVEYPKSEEELRANYQKYVASLDVLQVFKNYPKAIQNLLSADPAKQQIALSILSASREVETIPWIVPLLDSPDEYVRTKAGFALEDLVASTSLKRRDPKVPERVALRPLQPQDADFRPLAWVVYRMLRAPDDPNLQSYAATMVGYIGLKEFEPEMRQLLDSRHPAVTNSARYALELLEQIPRAPRPSQVPQRAKD